MVGLNWLANVFHVFVDLIKFKLVQGKLSYLNERLKLLNINTSSVIGYSTHEGTKKCNLFVL